MGLFKDTIFFKGLQSRTMLLLCSIFSACRAHLAVPCNCLIPLWPLDPSSQAMAIGHLSFGSGTNIESSCSHAPEQTYHWIALKWFSLLVIKNTDCLAFRSVSSVPWPRAGLGPKPFSVLKQYTVCLACGFGFHLWHHLNGKAQGSEKGQEQSHKIIVFMGSLLHISCRWVLMKWGFQELLILEFNLDCELWDFS